MVVTADHSADVKVFPIGWTWTEAPIAVVGTDNAAGTGLFGFTVYKNIAGSQIISIDENSALTTKLRYRVVVTNPTSIANFTLQRLIIELQCLGYAVGTGLRLPRIGHSLFSADFGSVGGAANLTFPRVKGIQYEPESERDPSVWIVTYTIAPEQSAGATTRPRTGATALKPNAEEAPWTLGPDVTIDFGTEDFTLGLGRYIGTKSPAQLGTALNGGTYAASFSGATASYEMIANSAGDPLESPPPMKTGTATIRINRSFELLPETVASAANTAIEEVCNEAVTANGITFKAFTCKLNSATIANKRWKRNADWLPKQLHPLQSTYADIGWLPPTGKAATDVAINYTRNTIPAYRYLDYVEVSITVAQRDLGWGYALIDKGYRDKKGKESSFSGRQSYSNVLQNGLFVDMSTGTADKQVLRLYQVHKTGNNLSALLSTMLDNEA